VSIAISTARAATLTAAGQENNPFFMWENLARGETIAGTPLLPGGAAENATGGATNNYWLPDVTGTTARFRVTFGTARTISFVGIAAHNIADYAGDVSIQRSNNSGATWSDGGAGTISPTDNSPIAFRMVETGANCADWRINITGLTAGDGIAIGVAFFGDEIVMPQRFYQGFAPVITPTEVELKSNVSVGGKLIGSSVTKRGSRLSTSFDHIDPTFLRGDTWKEFQAAYNDGNPAFFGWRPEKYPEDLHYIWRDGAVIRPENSGPRDLMSVAIQARAYEG